MPESPAPLHLGVNHSGITDYAGTADSGEEANAVCVLTVDIQIGDGMLVALEHGI